LLSGRRILAITSAFQADEAGSIPAARSKKPFPTHYLQSFGFSSDKLPTQKDFSDFASLSSKLMKRVRFPPPAPENRFLFVTGKTPIYENWNVQESEESI
jgi:hypothetical protein